LALAAGLDSGEQSVLAVGLDSPCEQRALAAGPDSGEHSVSVTAK